MLPVILCMMLLDPCVRIMIQKFAIDRMLPHISIWEICWLSMIVALMAIRWGSTITVNFAPRSYCYVKMAALNKSGVLKL